MQTMPETIQKVKERPILFSAPMVRAILDLRKTVTRRICNPQPCAEFLARGLAGTAPQWPLQDGIRWFMRDGRSELVKCPYQPGMRLWIRETFTLCGQNKSYAVFKDGAQKYKDGSYFDGLKKYNEGAFDHIKWKPSIFMPRWASRITLEVESIHVGQIQDSTPEDVIKEGLRSDEFPIGGEYVKKYGLEGWEHRQWRISPVDAFEFLWDSINKKRGFGWNTNPWVYRIEFKRIPQP